MATIVKFLETNETFMEVIDLEIVANNTNLPKLVQEILSKKAMKEDDEDEYEKIGELEEKFETQRLFDGYDFYEAYKIISKYYKEKDSSLTNEIKAINEAYHTLARLSIRPGIHIGLCTQNRTFLARAILPHLFTPQFIYVPKLVFKLFGYLIRQ